MLLIGLRIRGFKTADFPSFDLLDVKDLNSHNLCYGPMNCMFCFVHFDGAPDCQPKSVV